MYMLVVVWVGCDAALLWRVVEEMNKEREVLWGAFAMLKV